MKYTRATADKTSTKPSRPWFKKKRYLVPLALVVVVVVVVLSSERGTDSSSIVAV